MEKETLEEILPKNSNGKYSRNEIEKAFELGAKWQSERMYSEEDVLKLLEEYGHDLTLADKLFEGTPKQWLEQFKKK